MVSTTSKTFTKNPSVLNQCEPNPCMNTGTCITFTNGIFYSCFCQFGYSGKFCEILPTTSMILFNLKNKFSNSKIFLLASTYQTTPSTVTFPPIITKPEIACQPNPCFNGGVCHSKGCICPSGYQGNFCEIAQSKPQIFLSKFLI